MEREDWGQVEACGDSLEGKISNRWVLPTSSKLWSAQADYEELTDGLVLITIKGKIFRMNDNLPSVERQVEREGGEAVELNASPRLVILVCRGLIALENRLQMPNLETLVKTAIQDQVRIKNNELLD